MHASCWQNDHIWEYALHVYQTGNDGIKNVAKSLGLAWSGLGERARQRGIPKKLHASTRRKLSGVRENTLLKYKWAELIKRVRKPYKPQATISKKRARALAYYYANHEENKARAKERAKAQYERKKSDPLFIAKKNARHAQYRSANKKRFSGYSKTYHQKHPEVMRAARRRRRNKPEVRMEESLRNRLRDLVNRGKAMRQSIRKLIGCTPAHLRAHIESQFKEGMGWHNRQQWHVDHIKPCASFDLKDPVQLSQCMHWTNLQPLWAKDNMAKGAKYEAAA